MTPDDEPTLTADPADGDEEGVEAEGVLLEKSQEAIDDAHDAVDRAVAADAIDRDD